MSTVWEKIRPVRSRHVLPIAAIIFLIIQGCSEKKPAGPPDAEASAISADNSAGSSPTETPGADAATGSGSPQEQFTE